MKIICTVTTDLNFDQRMARICSSLHSFGHEVELVGREKSDSNPILNKDYKQTRLKCFFEKGKLFYLEYNIRLFFYLLRQNTDVVCSCDLDTILPGLLKKRFHKTRLVYDAHEYFSEMEEVVARPMIRWVWKKVEAVSVPKTDLCYTVSKSYADLFKKEYGKKFGVIRNVTSLDTSRKKEKKEKYILYQGAVNHGRGLHSLIKSMPFIDCQLVICGNGDVYEELKALVQTLGLKEKVNFIGYLEPAELKHYTINAYIGITLFTNQGMSNQYSLANRFFDYMHAGVPQLAMNYPEYRGFNEEFEVASLIDNVNEVAITSSLNHLLKNESHYERLRSNAFDARLKHNWQSDERKLESLYASLSS